MVESKGHINNNHGNATKLQYGSERRKRIKQFKDVLANKLLDSHRGFRPKNKAV